MAIPPELVQPLPRRVRTTGWFKAMVAIFTVLFPGVGLVMSGVTYGVSHDKAVLKEKGLPIVAEITELRVERSRNGNLFQWGAAAPALIIKQEQVGGRRPSMTATYQFTDAQGGLVTSTQKGLPSEKKLDWPGFREARERVTQNPTALYDPANSDKSMLYRAGFLVCCQP